LRSKTALSASASFEVRSPKLLQVSFEEGRVATPQLLADLQLPASLDVLGQRVDLAPLQAALQPVEGPLRTALGTLSGLLSQVPDLRIPVRQVQASSWLLTTYLGEWQAGGHCVLALNLVPGVWQPHGGSREAAKPLMLLPVGCLQTTACASPAATAAACLS
jgi:hypothetical protein